MLFLNQHTVQDFACSLQTTISFQQHVEYGVWVLSACLYD